MNLCLCKHFWQYCPSLNCGNAAVDLVDPLSNRAFEDEGKARLGVVECAKHELLQPFSVLHEKEGETVVLL